MWHARIYVKLKPGILDPEGKAVQSGLTALGYDNVQSVRTGKFIELDLDATDRATAKTQAEEMCRRLLANPVMEEFEVDMRERLVEEA